MVNGDDAHKAGEHSQNQRRIHQEFPAGETKPGVHIGDHQHQNRGDGTAAPGDQHRVAEPSGKIKQLPVCKQSDVITEGEAFRPEVGGIRPCSARKEDTTSQKTGTSQSIARTAITTFSATEETILRLCIFFIETDPPSSRRLSGYTPAGAAAHQHKDKNADGRCQRVVIPVHRQLVQPCDQQVGLTGLIVVQREGPPAVSRYMTLKLLKFVTKVVIVAGAVTKNI